MNVFIEIHVGLDDLDTPIGGCTTHITYRLVKALLSKKAVKIIDYPNLVRLNPAIPFKTRGNGGTAIRFMVPESITDEVVNYIIDVIENLLIKDTPTPLNHGIVILRGRVPKILTELYRRAVSDYITLDYVGYVLEKIKDNILYVEKTLRRGLVGALASIGWVKRRDVTYELLVYRDPSRYGTERCINHESIIDYDNLTKQTYLNYDYSKKRSLISPSGPDPVLYGVRGDDPGELLKALNTIKVCEPIEGWIIFKSNQCTNDHYVIKRISKVRTYQAVCVDGIVISEPKTIKGGVTILRILDDAEILVAGFREGKLNSILQKLRRGDVVRVCGITKPWNTDTVIQSEKIVIRYINKFIAMNPKCPICGLRLKSAGKNKGFKCPSCGYRTSKNWRVLEKTGRDITEGLYLPEAHAFKHLMKPLERYGRERSKGFEEPIEGWIK